MQLPDLRNTVSKNRNETGGTKIKERDEDNWGKRRNNKRKIGNLKRHNVSRELSKHRAK